MWTRISYVLFTSMATEKHRTTAKASTRLSMSTRWNRSHALAYRTTPQYVSKTLEPSIISYNALNNTDKLYYDLGNEEVRTNGASTTFYILSEIFEMLVLNSLLIYFISMSILYCRTIQKIIVFACASFAGFRFYVYNNIAVPRNICNMYILNFVNY
jgi:hypothetical protein